MRRVAVAILFALIPSLAFSQAVLQQAGPASSGHAPAYASPSQTGIPPIVLDSGPAAGGGPGAGLSELNVTARGTGTPPFVGQGTGPNGEVACILDAPTTNPTGYHYLCFSANVSGNGLVSYGAQGSAATGSLTFLQNGAPIVPGEGVESVTGTSGQITATPTTGAVVLGLPAGAAASNIGTLGGVLSGTLPNPGLAVNAVANSNLAQMPANTIKGNNTGGTANALDLTGLQTERVLQYLPSGTGGVQRALDAVVQEVVVSPVDFGADCTAAAGSDTALTSAFTASPVVRVPNGCALKTSTNLTIARGNKLIMPCGSSVSPANSTTLTINGVVETEGLCQIFGTAHSLPAGTVAGVMFARPEYWGAYNDNSHDDAAAVQQAINNAAYAGISDYPRGKLIFNCGAGYRVGSTPSVTLPQQHFVEIYGCGMNPLGNAQAGGIIVNDSGNTVSGLALTGLGTNFHIHDLNIRPATDGKGICGISLNTITTNSGAIVSNVIERVQIGLNISGTTTGFGTAGICENVVLEVGIRDSTVFMGNKSGARGLSVVTDTTGPSGDSGWDHVTVVCSTTSGTATANCASSNPLFFQTTAGACSGSNCWVQGMHITNSFIYPFTAQQVVYMNARGTNLVPDFWFDGVQFDNIQGLNGQVFFLIADSGAELDNIQIHNNYFVGGNGSGGMAVLYDNGGSGHTNYIDFSHNYVNIGAMCASPAAAVISINGGKDHQIIGNRFTSACGSTGGDINIGGGSPTVTSVVIANNTTNCAAAGATSSCGTASSWFIQAGANVNGMSVYNNACYFGNDAANTGCVTTAGTHVNHSNNCNQTGCN